MRKLVLSYAKYWGTHPSHKMRPHYISMSYTYICQFVYICHSKDEGGNEVNIIKKIKLNVADFSLTLKKLLIHTLYDSLAATSLWLTSYTRLYSKTVNGFSQWTSLRSIQHVINFVVF
jgi:hypothetical protein